MSQLRPLGRSGLMVSPLAFGGNVFGWTVDEATSFKLLDAWLDAGFNFVDTADVYSAWVPGHVGGESESIIGKWLKQQRQTQPGGAGHQGRQADGRRQGGPEAGTSARPWRRRCGACRPTTSTSTSRTTTMPRRRSRTSLGAYADLIKAGKVRAIGASNYTAERLAAALDASERTACRATRACSRCTTCTTAPCSRMRLEPLCVKAKAWA
jgi:hypothetical protein